MRSFPVLIVCKFIINSFKHLEKGYVNLNLEKKKIASHYFFRISQFFFMSLQIFLYQGLAGLRSGIFGMNEGWVIFSKNED